VLGYGDLDELGENDWELVSMVIAPDSDYGYKFYYAFKRPIDLTSPGNGICGPKNSFAHNPHCSVYFVKGQRVQTEVKAIGSTSHNLNQS
jgi:hypothetical protein